MKQYMPCKPNPYGFKKWGLCDSETGYLVDFNVYFGAQGDKPETGLTTDVVLRLIKPEEGYGFGSGYLLCVDNYYTSRDLMQKLWEMKVMSCGTLRRNRRGYPKQLAQSVKKSYRGDFRWVKDGICTYYEWNDNSQVALVSTIHSGADGSSVKRQVKNEGKIPVPCPPVIPFYNKYMGGVDNFDHMTQVYGILRKCCRWTNVFLYWFVDSAIVNGYVLFQKLNPHVSTQCPYAHVW